MAPRGEKPSGEPDLGASAKQKPEVVAGITTVVNVDNLPKRRDAVGLRVAKDLNQGVFLGTVMKYIPHNAPDECPLWQTLYDNGDKGQYEESDLKVLTVPV